MTSRPLFAALCALVMWGSLTGELLAAPRARQKLTASRARPAAAAPTPTQSTPMRDIDWAALRFDSDADALRLWKQISPTGRDWERKLDELPSNLPIIAHALALAMLRTGKFTCADAPIRSCDGTIAGVPAPGPRATLADPCLRRQLAIWSFDQLDSQDIPKIRSVLRSMASMPPPESELVAIALRALPTTDIAGRFELIELAWKAGQRELVNQTLGGLDEPRLVDAVLRLHIDGALDLLSVDAHRAVYMKAVLDDQLEPAARVLAINQLSAAHGRLSRDVTRLLVAAAKHRNCAIAAAAARALETHGDRSFVPMRPASARQDAVMRSLCVLAAYESMQNQGEPNLLQSYVPARGMEILRVQYDPYNAVDADGDGDPHMERSVELVERRFARLPENKHIMSALEQCSGTTCTSRDYTFAFEFRHQDSKLVLWRVQVIDRVPCKY